MEEKLEEGLMTDEEKDAVFTDEERINQILKLDSDSYTRTIKRISIHGINYQQPMVVGRRDTIKGLTQSVSDLGVVTPIHVMEVPEDQKDEDYQYLLLDGLRRIFAALKNGEEQIDAVVWDFKDKEKAKNISLIISLIFNRVQKRSMSETWNLYQILEMQDNFTPGTLEYLLQLRAGDAMKIKDIMLCDYDEVKDAFLHEEKDIDGCYRMLQKFRKEENEIEKSDSTGMGDVSDTAGSVANEAGKGQLSDEDVKELLEMSDNLDNLDDVSPDDFKDMNKVDSDFIDQQKVGERHPLDPALRNAVLARDNFTCTCCGMRMIGARLGLIAVHHKLPVHVGGQDTIENLTTLCVNCHLSLHIMEKNGGSIMMSEADYNNLTPEEQNSLKKALKLARIAIEADKRRGLSKQQVAEATHEALRHPMPGVGMKENEAAYAQARRLEKVNGKDAD